LLCPTKEVPSIGVKDEQSWALKLIIKWKLFWVLIISKESSTIITPLCFVCANGEGRMSWVALIET